MTKIEIWLLAVGLAMDCFAISIASGILLKRTLWRPMLTMAFFFGLFQALMPLIGWACASTFSHLIEDVDHWIAFGILAFLGGRMVRESFKEEECRHDFDPTHLRVILMLAVATSIDALAVGVSFAFLGMKSVSAILPSVGIIGFVSFALSLAGLLFGIRFGCGIARRLKAELWGGIILILIGLKILIEHLIQHYG
ncbi:manganese efflux pump MntP family protein [uncultured Mediterranea sp.]|uniref:manganese efflux pump MntP n=1 Tax=uncultured Mediterranea sp. TaxID=1926662 RepID=UPI0028062DB3|nr:manganese efflux pump MntP family protein [uncultured Mediterranea sp.]